MARFQPPSSTLLVKYTESPSSIHPSKRVRIFLLNSGKVPVKWPLVPSQS